MPATVQTTTAHSSGRRFSVTHTPRWWSRSLGVAALMTGGSLLWAALRFLGLPFEATAAIVAPIVAIAFFHLPDNR